MSLGFALLLSIRMISIADQVKFRYREYGNVVLCQSSGENFGCGTDDAGEILEQAVAYGGDSAEISRPVLFIKQRNARVQVGRLKSIQQN